jgi:hypothetical protein
MSYTNQATDISCGNRGLSVWKLEAWTNKFSTLCKLKDLIVLGAVELKSKMTRNDPNFNWFKQEEFSRRVAKIIVWRESFQKVLKEERKGCS